MSRIGTRVARRWASRTRPNDSRSGIPPPAFAWTLTLVSRVTAHQRAHDPSRHGVAKCEGETGTDRPGAGYVPFQYGKKRCVPGTHPPRDVTIYAIEPCRSSGTRPGRWAPPCTESGP